VTSSAESRVADHASGLRPRRGYADTRFGQLHFAEMGAGPVILLLHQTPRSHDEFRELQPLLAQAHRVIAMDMLGFGQSAPLAAPQTIEAIAAGSLSLLDALGLETASVLGHHTGGAVALEMAAAQPDRVPALVLSSTPWLDGHYRDAHRNGAAVDAAEPSQDGRHLQTLWSTRRLYYPADCSGLLNRFIRDALAPGVDPVEGHRACARYVMEDRIGLVTAPTLIIGASADPFSFPAVARLRSHLVNAPTVEVVTIDGGMVPLMEQAPDRVSGAVLEFLTGVPGAD